MMNRLYTEQAAQQWKQRAARLMAAVLLTAAAGLAACIFLCTRVTTGSAQPLLFAVIALSTLTGWAVILLVRLGFLTAKAEAEHIAGVLAGESETAQGIWTLSRQRWIIPHSVTFCKATLRDGDVSRVYNVDVRLASVLPEDGTPVRVTAVRRFITAWEVQHEEA